MADQPATAPAASPASKWTAWVKPVLGTVAGLFSGALVMYMSPLLDKVFKPAKPVANFAADHEGLTVTFHNRSQAHQTGWWDFGDGSPLEMVQPDQEVVTHTYEKPGDYTIKLLVRNSLGEPDERSTTLRLNSHHGEPPQIAKLDAYPLSPGSIAPATFRVVSQVKNAQVCVWDLDDDRPLDIVTDCAGGVERLVTFDQPGGYVIKLAAVNGNEAVEKSEIINVMERPRGFASAVLTVTDQATRVEKLSTPFTFVETFPAALKADVHAFQKQAPARQGFEILEVRLQNGKTAGPSLKAGGELAVQSPFLTGVGARSVKLQLTPDRKAVVLSGELARDPIRGKKDPVLPNVSVPVAIVQEKRSEAHRPPATVTASFKVPGSTLLALPDLPPDWIDARRQLRLQLLDDDRVAFQDALLPKNRPVTIQGKRYRLSAEKVGEHVRIDVNEDAAAPVGN
jgi:PKD repeat protein